MRRLVLLSAAAVILLVPAASGFARAGDVSVTVSYTGKGKVDDTHEIWVALFSKPDMSERPIAVQPLRKSGGTTVFKAVAADAVYVMFAYDEKGDWDGTAGPPPPGTPVGSYSTDGKAAALVKVVAATKVKGTFNDSSRVPQ